MAWSPGELRTAGALLALLAGAAVLTLAAWVLFGWLALGWRPLVVPADAGVEGLAAGDVVLLGAVPPGGPPDGSVVALESAGGRTALSRTPTHATPTAVARLLVPWVGLPWLVSP